MFNQILSCVGFRKPTQVSETHSQDVQDQEIQSPTMLHRRSKFEEEKVFDYTPDSFYPLKIGGIVFGRYIIIAKLGWGSNSTVWLARDGREFLTLKACRKGSSGFLRREIGAYRRINIFQTDHPGVSHVRRLIEHFEIANNHGSYLIMIHEPLSMSLFEYRYRHLRTGLPEATLKRLTKAVLIGLDYLHTVVKLVHCDIKEDNVLFELVNKSGLKAIEIDEHNSPSERKFDGDHVIYKSREIGKPDVLGRPIITDFGLANWGRSVFTDPLPPRLFRPPETILEYPWNHTVDIWGLGVMIWGLFEPDRLFIDSGDGSEYSEVDHLAQIIALIGPPPKTILNKSKKAARYFDINGNFTGDVNIRTVSLEEIEERLDGTPKQVFLNFMKRILVWEPMDRPSAQELLMDPWFTGEVAF